jgi:hypothetical protein
MQVDKVNQRTVGPSVVCPDGCSILKAPYASNLQTTKRRSVLKPKHRRCPSWTETTKIGNDKKTGDVRPGRKWTETTKIGNDETQITV